ncbi:MAG: AraC family transcriptional regulator [Proteobacteria bacterium]|nr:AraC family transcriptional regulator [Pseudomonadota bacterium]
MFHFKGFMPEHSIERVVPTGHVFLIFELDGIKRHTFDNETLKPNNSYTKVWVSGVHKHYISISAHKNSEMFVIQFKPFGAYPFIHRPIDEISDKIITADKIFGRTIFTLRKELLAKETSGEKFKIVEGWLNRIFSSKKIPPTEIINIIKKLHSKPTVNYKKIIQSYSKTQKHLIDQFKKHIGITPKYYQRIIRFNEILQQIHQSKKIDWSQIAYQFEYTDQSHFIKEFKHFSGIKPEKFINQNYHKEELNFFPLDQQG